ncbi:cation transporter [Pseudonocardia sp. C8]|uniref:MnhB domain-containing protein n=1 Tax=Pseudonocardia sp. C8 TaxID=2762759 RepID=UPI001642EA19|nr:MnhB domain-containing protein [Pseudonocardia sp. C8]MBC3190725.1 cation transporter [Pseudonocardia sp. C8]
MTARDTSADRASGPPPEAPPERPPPGGSGRWDQPSAGWMLPGTTPDSRGRTLVLEAAARLLFPTVLVFSLYLLLEGHYGPGGGFSGGLVAGLAFVLRHIAGSEDPGAPFGIRPPVIAGTGLVIAVLTALAPVVAGDPVLSSTKWYLPLGPFGQVDVVSSLILDVGVYLLIIGVVLDLLRSLGSGIARDARAAGEHLPPGTAGGDR